MIATDEIRLNLGSRDRQLDGFLNVDIDKHPGVDVVADVRNLEMYDSESVEEILASHILEHFPHTETLDVLKEWNRVLKPGGMLYVAVPDFARAVELYKEFGINDWVENFLMGDQGYKTAYHYSIFDEGRLANTLYNASFSKVLRADQFPPPFNFGCSMLCSTHDEKLVSLNMVAIK